MRACKRPWSAARRSRCSAITMSTGHARRHCCTIICRAVGARPRIYIPDRMTEGYGPSARAMLRLKDEGASLVVTVDCGAAADERADGGARCRAGCHRARSSCGRARAARLRARQSKPAGRHCPGRGIFAPPGSSFLFLVALNRSLRERRRGMRRKDPEPDLRAALDLVGLATICDVVPLTGRQPRVRARGSRQIVKAANGRDLQRSHVSPRRHRPSRHIIWDLFSGRGSMPAGGSGDAGLASIF